MEGRRPAPGCSPGCGLWRPGPCPILKLAASGLPDSKHGVCVCPQARDSAFADAVEGRRLRWTHMGPDAVTGDRDRPHEDGGRCLGRDREPRDPGAPRAGQGRVASLDSAPGDPAAPPVCSSEARGLPGDRKALRALHSPCGSRLGAHACPWWPVGLQACFLAPPGSLTQDLIS